MRWKILSLQAATHPPLPCFESVVRNIETDTIFFMIRAHGKEQRAPILDLLRDLDITVGQQPAGTFDVSEYAAAFLFDANGEGLASTLANFRNCYTSHFGDLSNLESGEWLTETSIPVGCYVFHKNAHDQTGTLENHLAAMAASAWPDRYALAERFVKNSRDDDRVTNNEAERLKAIITVTGQFGHPGDPMSIIIDRKGIPRAEFEESLVSAEVAKFLTQHP